MSSEKTTKNQSHMGTRAGSKAAATALEVAHNPHTPGPWRVAHARNFYCETCDLEDAVDAEGFVPGIHILAPSGRPSEHLLIAEMGTHPTEANAEFIVRACNNHGELLAALKRLQRAVVRCSIDRDAADHSTWLASLDGQISALDHAASVIAKAEG